MRPFMWLFEQLLCRKTSDGAKTYIWAALAGKNNAAVRDNLRGAYTTDCKIIDPSDFAASQEGRNIEKRIWVCTCILDYERDAD
jgi:hypothetical protein